MESGRLNMSSVFIYAFMADCIYIMTELSTVQWLRMPYTIPIVIQLVLAICSIWYFFKNKCYSKLCYLMPMLVLVLVLTGIVRGIFSVEGYWGYKGWLQCSLSALSFVLLFPLGSTSVSCKLLQSWNKYLFPVFILFCTWAMPPASYAFQVAIVYYFYLLLTCIGVSDKKAIFITVCGVASAFIGMENRSGVIKTLAGIMLCSTLWLPYVLRKITNITSHFTFYLLPICLLILGFTGTFNIFQALVNEESTEITTSFTGYDDDEEVINESLTADTRTFIYEEVFLSAIVGDYVMFGNTVGRGNTHNGEWTQDVEGLDDSERLMNEAGMLNIFTWMGLVGVILYTLMYLQASCLGLFCSNNQYVPIIASAVAFHWAMSWLEESTQFTPMDFSLFLLMGICCSPRFRKMSDTEFRLWFLACFSAPNKVSLYDICRLLKIKSLTGKLKD